MYRLLIALLLFAACGGEQPAGTTPEAAAPRRQAPPAAEEARELIESSPSFSEFEFTSAGLSLPVDGSRLSPPSRTTVRELAESDWLELDSSGNVALTDRSGGDRRFILRPNGILDIVPLARKEMGEVEAVRENADGTVDADFTWRWLPNEVGSALQTGPIAERFAATQYATASLIWNGTEWTMLKIERRQPPA
jgi:hypothetical protein